MFVRASTLYDPTTGTRIMHPALQASDEAVRLSQGQDSIDGLERRLAAVDDRTGLLSH